MQLFETTLATINDVAMSKDFLWGATIRIVIGVSVIGSSSVPYY